MLIWDRLGLHKEGTLSFTDSVALFFEIYPQKQTALKSFFAAEDQFSWKKLRAGLDAKFDELQANAKASEFKHFTQKHPKNEIKVELLPEHLRNEYAKLGPIIRRVSQLQARLKYAPTNADRFEIAKEIVELVGQRRAIFTMIDSFNQSGFYETPVVAEKVPVDATKLRNYETEDKLRKLMSRRSKAKGKPEKLAEYNDIEKQIAELRATRYL